LVSIELTRIYFKFQHFSEWCIDLIFDDEIQTEAVPNKAEALRIIKVLQLKFNIKGFKRCKDETG